MKAFKKSARLYSAIGVGCALLVPALAVGLEIPRSFTAGSAIRAADMNENFDAIAADVNDLREQLEAVQAKLKVGPQRVLSELTEAAPGAIYQVKTSGVISILPAGSGFGDVGTNIRAGDAVSGTNEWELTCGNTTCNLQSRGQSGTSTNLAVGAGQFVLLTAGAAGSAFGRILWTPLYGPDPAGQEPELIRSGAP